MNDIECTHCDDTGYITVRTTYPMSYVCAGSPPDDAKGVTEARCDQCNKQFRHSDISSGFHLFRDGNMWCAVGPHFQDLMKSNAGFGHDHAEAVADLHKHFARDRWWANKPLPGVDRFTIHEAQ